MSLPVVHSEQLSRVVSMLHLDRQIKKLLLNQYVTLCLDVGFGLDLQHRSISIVSSGNNVVVPKEQGRKIKVFAYVLVVGGAVNLTWISGTIHTKSGIMEFANKAEGIAVSVVPPFCLFETVEGEDLNLNLSAAEGVGGHISFWRE